MFNKLKCRFNGHRMLCQQVITLDPEGHADLDHTHECIACGKVKTFERETLSDEMVAMLQSLVAPQRTSVRMDVDPPTYIH